MRIRPEQPDDYEAIDDVVGAAFGQPDEALLVRRLRETSEHLPALSFVAVTEGQIVGHMMFSRITVEPFGDPGVALAPVSVVPQHQGQGIGSRLVVGGLTEAERLGQRFAVVLGHPEYYSRFGFVLAGPLGIEAPWDVPAEAWMIRQFAGAPPRPGTVRYSAAFS